MKITFVGVGSMAADIDVGQSNILIESQGKLLLFDCGMTALYLLRKMGLDHNSLDAIYVSHLHCDHAGGVEIMGNMRYFDPNSPSRPLLFMERQLMNALWNKTVSGGLETIEGKVMDLGDYYDCRPFVLDEKDPVYPDKFEWQGLLFEPIQTVHIMSGRKIQRSYGVMIHERVGCKNYKTFITADTQFAPYQLRCFYDRADVIFHDCETTPYKSGVHANYVDLLELPEETRGKMWLYHYNQPKPPQDAVADGFCGFVTRGQTFPPYARTPAKDNTEQGE